MTGHNIRFYEELSKIIIKYSLLSTALHIYILSDNSSTISRPQSLSLSPSHYPDMTEIPLTRMKNQFINSFSDNYKYTVL